MDDWVHFADRDGSESVGQGLSRPAGALAAVEGCDPRTAMIASRPPSAGRMAVDVLADNLGLRPRIGEAITRLAQSPHRGGKGDGIDRRKICGDMPVFF